MCLNGHTKRITILTTIPIRPFAEPQSPEYKFICADRIWHVHKHIVSRATSSFDYGLSTNRENLFNGLTVDAVDAMLAFLYFGNYNDDIGIDADDRHDTGPIWLNIQTHVAARRVNIPALGLLSTLKFTERARPVLQTSKFASAVKEIYTVSPQLTLSLQESVISMYKDEATEILSTESSKFADIRRIAREVPLFATQLQQYDTKVARKDKRKRESASKARTPTDGNFGQVYEVESTGQEMYTCRRCDKAIQFNIPGEVIRFCPCCGCARNRYMG